MANQKKNVETKEPKERMEIVQLSEVQLKNLGNLTTQDQMLRQQLKELDVRKADLIELVLDSKGWTGEKISAITSVEILADQGGLKITHAYEEPPKEDNPDGESGDS